MVNPVIIGNAELWRGDCLEILPTLGKVDAVITDPPYGIDFSYETYNDTPENWFALMDSFVPICKEMAAFFVMPCCKQTLLGWWFNNHNPHWIMAWYKGSPGHRAHVGFNDWEPHLVWGKPPKQIHDYFQTPLVIEAWNGHPCPKPVAYAEWLVSRGALQGGTVADPFMGSGTTGVACMNLGRKFIGIEINERYFQIACERIENSQRQVRMFE